MIAKGRYAPGTRRVSARKIAQGLRAHLNYNEYRSRGENEAPREFFDRDGQTDRAEIMQDFEDHSGANVAYHKFVLSPNEEELRGIDDLREWTRDVMRDLEARQGQDLHWAAVIHENTDNPHVHVVIAGQTERDGHEAEVRLYSDDYRMLRESGHDHSRDREPERVVDDREQYNDRLEKLFGREEAEPSLDHELERQAEVPALEIEAPERAMELIRDIGFER